MKNAREIVVGKPDGKRPLGRARRRLENDIKIEYTRAVCKVQVFTL
jgi:hypothetical protein